MNSKNTLLIFGLIIVVGIAGYFLIRPSDDTATDTQTGMSAGENSAGNNQVEENSQDPAMAAGSLIVGSWQSTDDTKFVREFKNGGVVTDLYDGKETSTDTFYVFSKVNPAPVSFPMEDGAVYIQIVSNTDQSELNFKVDKITQDTLELTYMDRGGILTFTRVQ